jgi:thioredoxin 1
MAREFTDQNFSSSALSSSQVVLVDFWAAWCGPCRAIAPMIEELSAEFEGRAVVGKLDIDQNQDIAMKYGVRSIPTLLILKNGVEVAKFVGATSKEILRKKLEEHM